MPAMRDLLRASEPRNAAGTLYVATFYRASGPTGVRSFAPGVRRPTTCGSCRAGDGYIWPIRE